MKSNEKEKKVKRPWYRNGFRYSLYAAIIIIVFLLIVWLMTETEKGFFKNQMVYPIDFNVIKEGQLYEVVSWSVHVFLRVFVDRDKFFTVGITTVKDCEGVFLSVPDLVSTANDFGLPVKFPIVITNIFGRLTDEQASYLRTRLLLPPECHKDGYKHPSGNVFHLHRVLDNAGKFAIYNRWNPAHPDSKKDNQLNHSVNCGTWLTYFLRMDPNFDTQFFSNFYNTHMKYMFGKGIMKFQQKIHITKVYEVEFKNGKYQNTWSWATIRYTEPQKVIPGSWKKITPFQKYRLKMSGYDFYEMREGDMEYQR